MTADDSDRTDESDAADVSNVTNRSETGGSDASSRPSAEESETASEVADADRSAAGERGDELPPILDVRDALDRVERDADADVSEELESIRTLLDQYERRDSDVESRASLVDDVDGLVVSMRERLSGDAERDAEGIENRLRMARNARNEASETLHVSGGELRDGDARLRSLSEYDGETATLDATLVNQGETRDGVLRLTFYDENDQPIRHVSAPESDLSADENRQVTETVTVPAGAAYYDVAALDATDAAASNDT